MTFLIVSVEIAVGIVAPFKHSEQNLAYALKASIQWLGNTNY